MGVYYVLFYIGKGIVFPLPHAQSLPLLTCNRFCNNLRLLDKDAEIKTFIVILFPFYLSSYYI
jgi:hypothetical protein